MTTPTPADFSRTLRRKLAGVEAAEDLLQEMASAKEKIAELVGYIGLLAIPFADADAGGAAGSVLRCSTKAINTLAKAREVFGPDFINPETDPVLFGLDEWYGAILLTEDPKHWRERARAGQWSAATIREKAGVKQTRRGPLYTGGGTIGANGNTVHLDTESEPNKRVGVRLVAKE